MKFLHDETLFRLQARALEGGATHRQWGDGRQSPHSLRWNVAGKCENPVTVEQVSRPDKDRKHKASKMRMVEMTVKCRKCPRCLRERAWLWMYRAKNELAASQRTWFITLTFNPTVQMQALNECRMALIRNGLDFDALSVSQQFSERHQVLGKVVTLFLKRLRKQSNASVRYMLVAEAHESGAPHYHMLLHDSEHRITYRMIENEWSQNGFLHAKLVDANQPKVVWYVCKYIAKSSLARVRASLAYGSAQRPIDIEPQIRARE